MDSVVCLGCGGFVDEGAGIPSGETACACPPPSHEAGLVTCSSCGGSLRVGARACPSCGSTVATRRCSSCLAWNLADARHCHGCGRALDTQAPSTGETQLPCPRCGVSLMARKYADLDVDECDRCGGLFVGQSMMDRLVTEREAQSPLRLALPVRATKVESTVRYVPCPVCKKTMNRRMFGRISGVIVDVCREHGVWFDAGELTQVLAFIERGGLQDAREREMQELVEAARSARAAQVRAATSHAVSQGSDGLAPVSLTEIIDMIAKLWTSKD